MAMALEAEAMRHADVIVCCACQVVTHHRASSCRKSTSGRPASSEAGAILTGWDPRGPATGAPERSIAIVIARRTGR